MLSLARNDFSCSSSPSQTPQVWVEEHRNTKNSSKLPPYQEPFLSQRNFVQQRQQIHYSLKFYLIAIKSIFNDTLPGGQLAVAQKGAEHF